MSKESKTVARIGILFMAITAGAVAAVVKYEEKKHGNREKELSETIAKAQKELDNLHEGVADAVRKVYSEEAKKEFSSSLKRVNVEAMAERYCEKSVKDLEETTIRKVLKDGYSSKADKLVKEELEKFFADGIHKYIDGVIDEESVRRITRKYVNDRLDEIVENFVEKKISGDDIKESVENYIRHHASEYDYYIRRALMDSIRDEDDIGKEIMNSIEIEFDSNSFLSEAIDNYLDKHYSDIEAVLIGKLR